MSVESKLGTIDITLTIIAVILAIAVIRWSDDRSDARDCESEHHHHWTGHVCRRDDGTNVEMP